MIKNNKGRNRCKNGTVPKTSTVRDSTSLRIAIKSVIVRLAVWGLIPAGFAIWLIQRGGLENV